ncbi:MAG: phosphoribosylamine--glycine ligase [Dysgonamonadaceae bacterium]|jgi:phosphoribosylamine--glycine ligase|nr:phosphoribosylamine--glycine ligase [Dysgonamonadaceae bacterium]
MNILLLGSGGRESALAWKISKSSRVCRLFIAPGNAGTALFGTNLGISANDFDAVGGAVLANGIDMVVVGPEEPLVGGIYDFFRQDRLLRDIPLIGPSRLGAQLEGSKDFAKSFMLRHGIPTARYMSVTRDNVDEGHLFLKTLHPPYVLKVDGLAAGKGVLIVDNFSDAVRELSAILDGRFGKSGETVVLEEFLSGVECSVFILTDGDTYKILPVAKDYKRIGEGDVGPNTGGMGSVSPVSFADSVFMEKVERRIIAPTVEGLRKENITYRGFIFFGLINTGGDPQLIEYNCRLGDPETESVVLRIESDLVDLLEGVAVGDRLSRELRISNDFSATVMLVSGGYPGSYEVGEAITGLDGVLDSTVFHAGTEVRGGGVVTSGGRVLAVSALGSSKESVLDRVYRDVGVIDFRGKYYRRDIGFDV